MTRKQSRSHVATLAFWAGVATALPFVGATSAVSASEAGVLVAQAQSDISGVWRGTFTNRQGTGFPVAFTLTVADGRITGTGDIPSSTIDKKPSVTGTVVGSRVVMQTSSGFRYDLTLNADGNRLSGNVSGANSGTLSLSR